MVPPARVYREVFSVFVSIRTLTHLCVCGTMECIALTLSWGTMGGGVVGGKLPGAF